MKTIARVPFRLILVYLVTVFAVSAGESAETVPHEMPVYVGRSGTKYHRFDCKTLKATKREISLAEAVQSGYKPCLVCKPPVGAPTGVAAAAHADGAPYRVNIENLISWRDADIKKMLRGRVSRHVDGDTVHITLENPPAGFNRVEKIRMIGVDTPETVHPNSDIEYFGREASDFTKNTILGKNVYIALDWDTRDKYGRLLAYIYTPDGRCHNAELIKQGYAHAYTRFSFQFLEEFRSLEREARDAGSGLWADSESHTANAVPVRRE